MKRWFGVFIVASVAGAAVAQAPFTIVRPADGSKVREKVHILIPKNSIPEGGYVGFFLNGKFMEATVPPLSGKNYDYVLDTKGKEIPDGPATLEAVLYVDYKDNPRIVDRSSVNITVGNHANIPIPAGGIRLRYHYVPGTESTYVVMQTVAVSTISGNENLRGGHPAEILQDEQKFRLSYAVDNAYKNGDGLVRIQPLPPKGKPAAFLTTNLNPDGEFVEALDMSPTYMRLDPVGRQLFGSIPNFIPMEGISGSGGSSVEFFAPYSLPVLPDKPVKPGGPAWSTSFQLPSVDLGRIHEVNDLVNNFPARGEFVDVEWEMGHPCAKIRHTIQEGTRSKEGVKLQAQGAAFTDEKIGLDETIWFALDKRQVMKVVRTLTVDQKAEVQNGGFGGPGNNPGGGPANQGGPRGIGPAGTGGGPAGTGPAGLGGGDLSYRGAGGQGRAGTLRPGGQGGPVGSGGQGPGRSGGGGGGGATQYVRIKQQQIFILEQ